MNPETTALRTPGATPAHTTYAARTGTPPRGGAARLLRGRAGDPSWARPALLALLALTALLYLWDLGASGYANSFYSAAVQAGSESWKAFFFGSSDASNSITVDKTPLALWPMALSVRVLGLSSWSILLPQAIEGVAAVGLLYAAIRRYTGSPAAGLIAGLTMALTPVAVLMFKFNNPDAMLVLLLVASTYATLRALEGGRPAITPGTTGKYVGHPLRWLALAGGLVGLAFLAKQLQAFLVLPPLVLVYAVVAAVPFRTRVGHLLVAFATMIGSAGWWIAIVSLWPAASRPYIGGSQNNSILELTLGYNGLGRLTGSETGSVGGGGNTGSGMWGSTGILRLFGSEIGSQVAWLLPAAIVLLVASLWFTRRAVRTDLLRASVLVWGGWLLVTGLTFSFMAGIFHAYYTVALTPAIGAMVGIGAWLLWTRRTSVTAMAVAAATLALTSVWSFHLLGEASDFVPWLRWLVLVGGLLVAASVTFVRVLPRRLALGIAGLALLASLAGPAAYAVQTTTTGHEGSIPTAGPSSGGGTGGGPGGGRTMGRPGGQTQGQAQGQAQGQTQGQTQGGTGGGVGGLLTGSTSTTKITAMLQADASDYRWAAAAVGSNTASGYQLASEEPVMPVGGFNGTDPSPTLAQFKAYVAAGDIHYFIASSGNGGGARAGSGSSSSSSIASWVAATYTATTVDGVTIYDLSGATS